jgi:nicotinamidase-related amidase
MALSAHRRRQTRRLTRESTGRFGMELGYHVTLVKDATAAFSQEAMHAAHAINGPTFAHAIVNTEVLIQQLSA